MGFQPLTTRPETPHRSIEKPKGTVDSIHVGIPQIPQKRPEEALINEKLPTEIFYKIFSFLNERDMKSTALVNRFWNSASIPARKKLQFILIKNFGKTLAQNIDQSEDLKKRILAITHDEKILKSSNLLKAKAIVFFQRESILEELEKLSLEKLKSLWVSFHSYSMPSLFKEIFELAQELRPPPPGIGYLSYHLEKLIDLGFVAKALDFFEKIPHEEARNLAVLGTRGIIRAHTLLFMRRRRPARNPATRSDLDCFLLRARAIDRLEEARKLFGPKKRNRQLSFICQIFLDEGDVNRALKTVEAIDSSYDGRDKLLSAICKGFIYEGHSNKALKIIEAMDSNYIGRTELLTSICKSLVGEGELNEALKAIRMVPDRELQNVFFSNISESFNGNRGTAKDLEIAYEIGYYKPRSLASQNISKAFIEKNDTFETVELFELIPDEIQRNLTLQDICETFTSV